jgi:hypothetical protein
MTVAELIKLLEAVPESSKNVEVFVRGRSLTANILALDSLNICEHSFFGKSVPCVVLEHGVKES